MRIRAMLVSALLSVSCFAAAVSVTRGQVALTASGPNQITNADLVVKVSADGREFSVATINGKEILSASSSISLEGGRIDLSQYSQATTQQSDFTDELGAGAQL